MNCILQVITIIWDAYAEDYKPLPKGPGEIQDEVVMATVFQNQF